MKSEIAVAMLLFLASSASFMFYFLKRTLSMTILVFIYGVLASLVLFVFGMRNAAMMNLLLNGLAFPIISVIILKPPKR